MLCSRRSCLIIKFIRVHQRCIRDNLFEIWNFKQHYCYCTCYCIFYESTKIIWQSIQAKCNLITNTSNCKWICLSDTANLRYLKYVRFVKTLLKQKSHRKFHRLQILDILLLNSKVKSIAQKNMLLIFDTPSKICHTRPEPSCQAVKRQSAMCRAIPTKSYLKIGVN